MWQESSAPSAASLFWEEEIIKTNFICTRLKINNSRTIYLNNLNEIFWYSNKLSLFDLRTFDVQISKFMKSNDKHTHRELHEPTYLWVETTWKIFSLKEHFTNSNLNGRWYDEISFFVDLIGKEESWTEAVKKWGNESPAIYMMKEVPTKVKSGNKNNSPTVTGRPLWNHSTLIVGSPIGSNLASKCIFLPSPTGCGSLSGWTNIGLDLHNSSM